MSKSASSSERELTQEERDLYAQQTVALEQASKIALDQYGMSENDRNYFDKIYRGELDKNDPAVIAEVANRLKDATKPVEPNTKDYYITTTDEYGNKTTEFDTAGYEEAKKKYKSAQTDYDKLVDVTTRAVAGDLGGISVDQMLFDSVKGASEESNKLLTDWQQRTSALGENYINSLSGLSDSFKTSLTSEADKFKATLEQSGTTYQDALKQMQTKSGEFYNKIQSEMGTVDKNVLAQQKGQQYAGISSAYQEARKQMEASLAQRGLTNSGVSAQMIGNTYQQEAMAKAQANATAYSNALGISNQNRMNQLNVYQQGLANQQQLAQSQYGVGTELGSNLYNLGTSTAQSVYGLGSSLAQTQYGIGTDYTNQNYNLSGNTLQQNIANLQMTSGVSQGVYGGAANYLAGAGSTYNQTASTAGQTALGVGTMQANYASAQAQAAASNTAGLYGAIGTAAGMYFGGPAYAAVAGTAASNTANSK